MSMVRGLSIFFSGNIAVQVIALLIMPIVTRLYSPTELGLYQFITTAALIVSPFIALSLNQAVVKETDLKKRTELFSVATTLIFISSVLFLALFTISALFYESEHSITVWHYGLFFCIVSLSSFFGLVNALMLNQNKYGLYTKSSIVQSLSSNISKVVLGLFSSSSYSLLLSLCIGASLSIYYAIRSNLNFKLTRHSVAVVKNVLKKNKGFTLFFTFSTFIGIFINWHIVLVAPLFGSMSEIGLLALALMITRTPMYPFLNSIKNYCYAEVVKKVNNNEGYAKFVILLAFVGLSISAVATLIFYIFGKDFIEWVFGAGWGGASHYAFILSFAMISSFVLTPYFFSIANIREYQSHILKIDVIIAVLSVVIVYVCLAIEATLLDFILYTSVLLFFSSVIKFTTIFVLEVYAGNIKFKGKYE
jgi:O-antigen/teichoic acid export membrane protein